MSLEAAKFYEELAFKFRQRALFEELDYFIQNKQTYLKPIYPYQRQIGKTYTLVELAHKYNCPIAVPTFSEASYVKRLNEEFFEGDVEVIVCYPGFVRGRRHELILCDENLSDDAIKSLKLCSDYLVGYVTVRW